MKCFYSARVLSLTQVFSATTFCPSVPRQDSLLCCPLAPSKGGETKKAAGIIGWDLTGGEEMGHRRVYNLLF